MESEHEKETDKVTATIKTRQAANTEEPSTFKSAIAEHARTQNHDIDWDNIKIIGTEDNKHKRWIKESIAVRKLGGIFSTMNRDEGGYDLPELWTDILMDTKTDN